MTRAPRPAKIRVANGPASAVVRSSTVMPSSGRGKGGDCDKIISVNRPMAGKLRAKVKQAMSLFPMIRDGIFKQADNLFYNGWRIFMI